VSAKGRERRRLLARVATFALALGLWFTPVPAGLTSQAWHLFAVFAAAIFSIIVNAFPLLTAAMLAAAAAVLTGTITPAKAFAASATPACCSWWWPFSWPAAS
jgi:DASS family divalent anion:Na+ symporter